jgi:hypothetical protein
VWYAVISEDHEGSLEDAKAWADEDPYIAAGVYRKVTVQPFKPVLP